MRRTYHMLEIALDAPDGTPRCRWSCGISLHLEIVLILTQGRCTVCVERDVGSEIVWTHPMELLGDMGLVESHFFTFGDSVSVRCKIGAHFAPNVPSAQKSL